MDIAFINGRYDTDFSLYGDLNFISFKALCESADLWDFYHRQSKHKYTIINHDCFKVGTIDLSDYIKSAREVFADEIVAPDVLCDMESTIKATKEFASLIKSDGFEVIGVVQGNSLEELKTCYIEYMNDSNISVAALSNTCLNNLISRSETTPCPAVIVLDYLYKCLGPLPLPIDLLGCTQPKDILDLNASGYAQYIRAIYTESPFTTALNELEYESDKRIPFRVKEVTSDYITSVSDRYRIARNMLSYFSALHS